MTSKTFKEYQEYFQSTPLPINLEDITDEYITKYQEVREAVTKLPLSIVSALYAEGYELEELAESFTNDLKLFNRSLFGSDDKELLMYLTVNLSLAIVKRGAE